jgi:glutamate dehydrogenase
VPLAIVDGSGVLCDPEGIERSELKRLAHNRLMVSHFDESKLSPNGFKILVEQQNIKLPSMFVICY